MPLNFVRMKIVLLVLFATLIKCAFSEFFSSTDELRNLVKNDKEFLDSLKELSNELEKTSLNVKK